MLLIRSSMLANLGQRCQTDEPVTQTLVTNFLKGCLILSYYLFCLLLLPFYYFIVIF